jgi:hypothetical protein
MSVPTAELKQMEKGEYMKTIAMRMFGKWDLGPEPIANPEVFSFSLPFLSVVSTSPFFSSSY